MSNSIGMQILQGVDNFCDVEDLDFFGQFADVEFDEIDKLSSFAIFLDEI